MSAGPSNQGKELEKYRAGATDTELGPCKQNESVAAAEDVTLLGHALGELERSYHSDPPNHPVNHAANNPPYPNRATLSPVRHQLTAIRNHFGSSAGSS